MYTPIYTADVGKNRENILMWAIHIIGWGILFAFPLMLNWQNRQSQADAYWYLGYVMMPVSFMAVFYLNYFILIPRLLFTRRWTVFLAVNILVIAAVWMGTHLWREFYMANFAVETPHREKHGGPFDLPPVFFVARDVMLFLLTVGLAVAIKMTSNWYRSENQKKEIERQRAGAELKNLRSQLNPHFLFNTLNNIYSLVEIDQRRAQEAVHELSGLLRYVLYEDNAPAVPLSRETAFISSYVRLMMLRTGRNVKVGLSLPQDDGSRAMVAPLLFISLIENAFKHGINPSGESSIDISVVLSGDDITCRISNGNFPKSDSDRSGSGIGLDNLVRRLDLIYPSAYSFSRGVENGIYTCTLIIPARMPDMQ